jgi:hypothetical protein
VLYILKPVLYELDAISHPLHDQPRSPEAKRASQYTTNTEVALLPFSEEVVVFAAPGRGGQLGGDEEGNGQVEEEEASVPRGGQLGGDEEGYGQVEEEEASVPRAPSAAAVGRTEVDPPVCALRDERLALTERVQRELFELNHPWDCAAVQLLECDSSKGLDQGTGSRLYFLTRYAGPQPPPNRNVRRLVPPPRASTPQNPSHPALHRANTTVALSRNPSCAGVWPSA